MEVNCLLKRLTYFVITPVLKIWCFCAWQVGPRSSTHYQDPLMLVSFFFIWLIITFLIPILFLLFNSSDLCNKIGCAPPEFFWNLIWSFLCEFAGRQTAFRGSLIRQVVLCLDLCTGFPHCSSWGLINVTKMCVISVQLHLPFSLMDIDCHSAMISLD